MDEKKAIKKFVELIDKEIEIRRVMNSIEKLEGNEKTVDGKKTGDDRSKTIDKNKPSNDNEIISEDWSQNKFNFMKKYGHL